MGHAVTEGQHLIFYFTPCVDQLGWLSHCISQYCNTSTDFWSIPGPITTFQTPGDNRRIFFWHNLKLITCPRRQLYISYTINLDSNETFIWDQTITITEQKEMTKYQFSSKKCTKNWLTPSYRFYHISRKSMECSFLTFICVCWCLCPFPYLPAELLSTSPGQYSQNNNSLPAVGSLKSS